MPICPTCKQPLNATWQGCPPCVAGSHHCKFEDCQCPVCDHPTGKLMVPALAPVEESTDGADR